LDARFRDRDLEHIAREIAQGICGIAHTRIKFP
jgi:hypothetical protein